jgi:tRNA(Ile2) C34 agmatinyltransferase TiaS
MSSIIFLLDEKKKVLYDVPMAKQRTRIAERTVIETERVCPVCREKFWGIGRAVYHAPECRRKADYERHADARRATRRETYQAEKKAAGKK